MILLDTHTVIWMDQGDRRLRPSLRARIEVALGEQAAFVSTISFWEVAMRIRKRQMDFIEDVEAWRQNLLDDGLIELPITGPIAAQAGLLSDLHGDPADRIIIATALAGNYELATADRKILEWPGPLRKLPVGR